MIQKAYRVGVYTRLSKDDEKTGESVSIENQKLLLIKYVTEQPNWTLHEIYVDDGWSGANFERPAFKRMLSDVKEGIINLIIVKDMSRLGRNYLEVGQLTDIIFPQMGCRFVALNDNFDSINNNSSTNDFMPFLNLFNEMHSRDTSKKVKAIKKSRAECGKFMGTYAPYGYRKDPNDKHLLIIDDRTAPVVHRIFEMRKSGMGYFSIASKLNEDKIAAPRETWYKDADKTSTASGTGLWSDSVIMRLMRNEVYLGHMVQGKQRKISFRSQKVINKPQEEWIKVENTHEAIIDQELWDRVQILNEKKHRPRKMLNGETNMYTGILKCADCGFPMRYQGRKYSHKDGSIVTSGSFLCSNYSRSGKAACTAHSIKEHVITRMVMEDIRRCAELIAIDENQVINTITNMRNADSTSRQSTYSQEIKQLSARISYLVDLIDSLYADKKEGSIPETVFSVLLQKYEDERIRKSETLESLKLKMADSERNWTDVSQWTSLIKKHKDVESLDAAMLLELIDRIEIGEARRMAGQKVCDINIYYIFLEDVNLNSLDWGAN